MPKGSSMNNFKIIYRSRASNVSVYTRVYTRNRFQGRPLGPRN